MLKEPDSAILHRCNFWVLFVVWLPIAWGVIGPPTVSSPDGKQWNYSDQVLSCVRGLSPNAHAVLPDAYDDCRIGTNFRYDSFYPALILNVTTITDIQAAVRCAAELELNIIPMNGGHSFEGMSCTDDILLHLDEFSDIISIDSLGDETFATVQSGIRLARLYGTIIEYSDSVPDNFVIAGGTCPTVGVTGHCLCGGYGMLGRYVGLTSDQVVEIQFVDASGALITATASNDYKDIFWSMKGGCSSAFGIITHLKFRLLKLPSPYITTIDIPPIPYTDDIYEIAMRWQTWATQKVTEKCTSTWHFTSEGASIQAVYLGSISDDDYTILANQLAIVLKNTMSLQSVIDASSQGSFLDAVLWWSNDSQLQSLEDLLSVKSLPPLDERSSSRRKSKSLFALKDPIPISGVQSLVNYFVEGDLNAIEWKAYGGVNQLTDIFYTDDRSPLLRGHLLEMHYGNSYGGEGSEDEDAELVQSVDNIGVDLQKYFAGPTGYVGYIDYDLQNPGVSYFGPENAGMLANIRKRRDPDGVLRSPASDYLYRDNDLFGAIDIYVGSFDSYISRWKLSCDGDLTFIDKYPSQYRNPSWIVPHMLSSGDQFLYTVDEVKDFSPLGKPLLGGISAYKIGTNGVLEYINSAGSGGGSPTHSSLAYNAHGQLIVYAANTCGSVSLHEIDVVKGYIYSSPVQLVSLDSDVKNVLNCNSSSFPHQIYLRTDDVYIVDKDRGQVIHFRRNKDTGLLIAQSKDILYFSKDSGPRHLIFHPGAEYAFLVFESSNEISVLSADNTGSLKVISTESMLRDGESGVGMAAAEVQVSRDGKFVYGSNRDVSDPNENRSSIVVFSFDHEVGELALLQHVSSEGIHPRHFDLFYLQRNSSYSDCLLVVANKASNSLATFMVDSESGLLQFTGTSVSTLPYHDEPVYVTSSTKAV